MRDQQREDWVRCLLELAWFSFLVLVRSVFDSDKFFFSGLASATTAANPKEVSTWALVPTVIVLFDLYAFLNKSLREFDLLAINL